MGFLGGSGLWGSLFLVLDILSIETYNTQNALTVLTKFIE